MTVNEFTYDDATIVESLREMRPELIVPENNAQSELLVAREQHPQLIGNYRI